MADPSAAADGQILVLAQQVAGAVMGGVVGGFAGFIANRLLADKVRGRIRRNVAAALAAEIDALQAHIAGHYLPLLRSDLQDALAGREVYHRYRGGRGYMPIFQSLGVHVGLLPSPLPRDLATWYVEFRILLERARELHDLFDRGDATALRHAVKVAELQCVGAEAVVRRAAPLVESLSEVAGGSRRRFA